MKALKSFAILEIAKQKDAKKARAKNIKDSSSRVRKALWKFYCNNPSA